MIKKLRMKFIVIAMTSISLVLSTIIGTLLTVNLINMNTTADEKLKLIADNGGRIPERFPNDMSPEAPYQTRYFTVFLGSTGAPEEIFIDKIAAVDALKAVDYALQLFNADKTNGFIDNYKYYGKTTQDGAMYVFLDCSMQLALFREFTVAAISIGAAGLLAIFLLVFVFSGIAFKPVAESYDKQKQFITDANHELKTPLTIIDADCDVLEMNAGANEWTESIKEQVKKLTELTNKLVFLSKMDEENANTIMTDFSLTEVAHDIVKPYRGIALAQGKEINVSIEPNLTEHGDIALIKELFTLLLDNAMKYSNDGGVIELSVTRAGKHNKITLSNTTGGVPEGNLDRLFERFYRLDSSRNSGTGGHGIGLSVAKAIVQMHGGKIGAESPDGKTIVFNAVI